MKQHDLTNFIGSICLHCAILVKSASVLTVFWRCSMNEKVGVDCLFPGTVWYKTFRVERRERSESSQIEL